MTNRLKEIMTMRGLTIKEVAIGSGVSAYAVSNIYKGNTREPTLDTMDRIAVFLRLTIDDIFESEGNE